MRKEFLISVDAWEERCALIEDGRPVEIFVERRGPHAVVGNIYLGKVADVKPGMEAAFIDIGEQRNAYLFYGHEAYFMKDGLSAIPLDSLTPGESILVQVTKEPLGDKGARVTSQISLAGRHLVGIPHGKTVAVSRRLEEAQRRKMSRLARSIQPENMGLIVRTSATEAEPRVIEEDVARLEKVWLETQRLAKKKKAPALLHSELTLPIRLVRDLADSGFEQIVIDSADYHDELSAYLRENAPHLVPKLRLYNDPAPLFESRGVETAIKEALGREVRLKSGGKIAIDHTEALTAIDVNTGRYTGKSNLDQTILRTNLEAAGEIVRQIRLRDLGGIIVVDLIDMRKSAHRSRVYDAFMQALAADRVRSKVVEISKMGLIEMTRKKSSEDLPQLLSVTCPHCLGAGRVPSDETLTIASLRKISAYCRSASVDTIHVKVNPEVAKILTVPGGNPWLDPQTGRPVFVEADPDMAVDEVLLVQEGRSARG